jgi:hypothetical protein
VKESPHHMEAVCCNQGCYSFGQVCERKSKTNELGNACLGSFASGGKCSAGPALRRSYERHVVSM